MIGVKFTRDMRPYGKGEAILLPNDIAQRLIAAGDAEAYEFPTSLYGAVAAEPSIEPPRPALTLPTRDNRRQTYQTKDVRR
jgi:hypothetical protein